MRTLSLMIVVTLAACAQPGGGKSSTDELGKAVVSALSAKDELGVLALTATAEQRIGACPKLGENRAKAAEERAAAETKLSATRKAVVPPTSVGLRAISPSSAAVASASDQGSRSSSGLAVRAIVVGLLRSVRGPIVPFGRIRGEARRPLDRQADRHRCPLARLALDRHRAVVERHQPLDQREPEPGAVELPCIVVADLHIGLADALEIPQTYGIAHDRVVLILADGEGIAKRLNGTREDDADGARTDVAAHGVGAGDCVIATSASGSTRYTVAGLEAARKAGARTVGIAGNAGTPLLAAAEIAVLLDAGPEVISGSTRMCAGTAQKAALNMLSTLVGVRLGHVYDGLMVNVTADNEIPPHRAAAARLSRLFSL